ncbi:hypothetical protein [Streptomyces sp. MZ04]|uniref:hypothetical protein n=1 Tax=Streptomyces sp. MZ04 TaxID=2559236 RepID=UPI00107EC394|nr:hypothetical protein [Streptomyces sp. MZ04]TGB14372.1 hypothetical protein E2651_05975 [Streptomyces sp. MZ04]
MFTTRYSRTRRVGGYAAAAAAVLALTASGCGDSGGGSGDKSSGGDTKSSATLTATKVDKVGTVVTNSKGYVLYRFDEDTAKPSKSNCNDNCAKVWPATPAPGKVTVKGIDKALVGTVTRDDGTKQLTLDGWPLYTYAKDDEPREAYGQGVDGTWYAITPTGAKAQSSTTDQPQDEHSGGGYGY